MNIEQQLVETKHWEDRYRLIIQAGKNLPEPNEEELATMQTIPGCEVQVWFKFTEKTDRTLSFKILDISPKDLDPYSKNAYTHTVF